MATPGQGLPQIFTLDQIEEITNKPSFQKDLIKAISDGFVAFVKGDFFAAPIQTLGAPPMAAFCDKVEGYAAQTCVKSGYFRNNPYYVIKVASGGHPLSNSGLMQVYSQQTGRLLALLLDEGILTELRTAAVGALAAQLFATCRSPSCGDKRKTSTTLLCVGIIGTGVQARYQLRFLETVVDDCRKVLVYGRSPDKARAFQQEMQKRGWEVNLAAHADDLLTQCDLIVTTTCAREAVLGTTVSTTTTSSSNIRSRLITCIGADAPGKMELDTSLVEMADVLVADSLAQTRERGEFQEWCKKHPDAAAVSNNNDDEEKAKQTKAAVYSLGQVIAGRTDLQRQQNNDDDDNRLIIFDSSGVALQDCVVAQMVYEALLASAAKT